MVEQAFDKYSELDQILKFSTPKVLRLVEVLRQVRPLNFVDPRKRRDKTENAESMKGGAQIEGSEIQAVEATADPERSEVSVVLAVSDGATSPENSSTHCKDQDDNEEKEKKSPEDSLCLSGSTQIDKEEASAVKNCVNDTGEISQESSEIGTKSENEMVDQLVYKAVNKKNLCNGYASEEESSLPNIMDMASPSKPSSKQSKICADTEAPEAVSECHANGWSSQDVSLDSCDCKPSVSVCSRKSEKGVCSEEKGVSCQHNVAGECLHNGEVDEVCREPSKVQIHPDVTQNCCNISESVVIKKAGDGSTLEEDLCRLSLRESSFRIGCELENPTNCDVSNGTTSAKSHLHDAAKVHNSISAPLCNGYQSGSEESLPSLRISEGGLDNKLHSHNKQESVSSIQGEEKQCLEQSHSVQSNLCDEEVQPDERVPLTSAHSTTSQPASEVADVPATLPEVTTAPSEGAEDTRGCHAEAGGATTDHEEASEATTDTNESSEAPKDSAKDNEATTVLVEGNEVTGNLAEDSEAVPQSAQSNSSVPSKDADSTVSPTPAVSSEAAAMADTLALLLPGGGGGKGGRKRRDEVKEKVKVHNPDDPDSVCGLIFVHHRNIAKIIYRLLKVNALPCLGIMFVLCNH